MSELPIRKSLIVKGLGLIAAIGLLFMLASQRPGDRRLFPAGPDGVTVYVINNGFHTDLAIPIDEVTGRGDVLAASARSVGPHRWLIYGWGDAGFFTAKGFSVARAADGLRALFWPNNPSVIRLYGIDQSPDVLYGRKVAQPVVLSRDGFNAMTGHIGASFKLRRAQPVLAMAEADGTQFFDSTEHFSFARSCNNWTADQLSAAGLPTWPAIDGWASLLALDLRMRAYVTS